MNAFNPNIINFPTKVIFLDDNQSFIDAIALEFHEQENMILLTNPDKAMHLCKDSSEDVLKLTTIEDESSNLELNNNSITKTINMVNMIYEPSRFDNIAVLVIDYSMPTA